MHSNSQLVNHARRFSLKHFRKPPMAEAPKPEVKPRSFTAHLVAMTAKLVMLRQSDAVREFTAICRIFQVNKALRTPLWQALHEAKLDPLPAEYHAKSLSRLYASDPEKCRKALRGLIRIVYASSPMVPRNEYLFLKALSREMGVSDGYFHYLCEEYHIEVPKADPYAVLGVHRFASKAEVKRRYYQLVRQYHPDHAGLEDAAKARAYGQKMMEINQAYARLSA